MFLIYIAALDDKKRDAVVKCPACSSEGMIGADEVRSTNWVACCGRCGAMFGVIPPERFETYVLKSTWFKGSSEKVTYCDFLVVKVTPTGSGTHFRWHGWVDADTRQIVQEG
jgi:hypothetical protein